MRTRWGSDSAMLVACVRGVTLRLGASQGCGEEDDDSAEFGVGLGGQKVLSFCRVHASPHTDTAQSVALRVSAALAEIRAASSLSVPPQPQQQQQQRRFRVAFYESGAAEGEDDAEDCACCDLFAVRICGDGWIKWTSSTLDATALERMAGFVGQFALQQSVPFASVSLIADAEELANVSECWQGARVDFEQITALQAFERCASSHPQRTAVVFRGASLTYKELDARSTALAAKLQVQPGDFVGLCVEPCAELIVAVLACFKAGAAYVPIDPTFPEQRLRLIVQDTCADTVLLTQSHLLPHFAPFLKARVILLDEEASISSTEKAQPQQQQSLGPESPAYCVYTSGSTGRPKGVVVPHRALSNLLQATERALHWSQRASATMFFSSAFDNSVLEIFYAICFAGTLHVLDSETRLSLPRLFAYIQENAIETVYLPPHSVPAFRDWLRTGPRLAVKSLLVGTEPLDQGMLQDIWALLPTLEFFYNEYGPTEATVLNTFYPVPRTPQPGQTLRTPIGRALENTTAFVVDNCGQLCPVGVDGEVFIGGVCLALGYKNLPEETARRFVTRPCVAQDGLLYRTGDIARWLPSGNLLFVGRIDDQVKWHGYRIEPAEIAVTLTQHPAVRQAIVCPQPDPTSPVKEKMLVAYVTGPGLGSRETAELLVRDLRKFASERLPLFMTPAAYVPMENFPLAAHGGKIDRKALPLPEDWSRAREDFVEPADEEERIIASAWEEVLRLPVIGALDNFFSLGGHSLQAADVLTLLRSRLGVEIPFFEMFKEPTVRGIAAISRELRRKGDDSGGIPHVEPFTISRDLALSESGMFMECTLLNDSSMYNEGALIDIDGGSLNVAALRDALFELVRLNPNLRSSFRLDEDWVPHVVEADRAKFDKELFVVESLASREAFKERTMEVFAEKFDIAVGPLARFRLLSAGGSPQRHRLVMVFHHLVCDGLSFVILVKQLGPLYNAAARGIENANRLPLDNAATFLDFVTWEKATQPPLWRKALEYWKEQLKGARVLSMPVRGLPFPLVRSDTTIRFKIPKPLVDKLHSVAKDLGATLFNILAASYSLVLSHWLGSDEDALVVAPWFNRPHQELETAVGCFINLLVLRARISDCPTFADLVKAAKAALIAALENPFPSSKLVRVLSLGNTGLVPSTWLLFYQNYALLDTEPFVGCDRTRVKDLDEAYLNHANLELTPHRKGSIGAKCDFCASVVPPDSMRRMLDDWIEVLKIVSNAPSTPLPELVRPLGCFSEFAPWNRELQLWAKKLAGCGEPERPLHLLPIAPSSHTATISKELLANATQAATSLGVSVSSLFCALVCCMFPPRKKSTIVIGATLSNADGTLRPIQVTMIGKSVADVALEVEKHAAALQEWAPSLATSEEIAQYVADAEQLEQPCIWRVAFRCVASAESSPMPANDVDFSITGNERVSVSCTANVAADICAHFLRVLSGDLLDVSAQSCAFVSETAKEEPSAAIPSQQHAIEQAIAAIFMAAISQHSDGIIDSAILPPAAITAETNFFHAGGTSLGAVWASKQLSRLAQNAPLPPALLYKLQTPRALALALLGQQHQQH